MDLSAVILLSLVGFLEAFNYRRRCLFFIRECVDHCPRNMHPYHPRCDGNTLSQRTCSDTKSYNLGYTCGWSRCDCNGDYVLDETIGVCVQLRDCSEELNPKRLRNRKKKMSFRTGKRVRTSHLRDPLEEYMRS